MRLRYLISVERPYLATTVVILYLPTAGTIPLPSLAEPPQCLLHHVVGVEPRDMRLKMLLYSSHKRLYRDPGSANEAPQRAFCHGSMVWYRQSCSFPVFHHDDVAALLARNGPAELFECSNNFGTAQDW